MLMRNTPVPASTDPAAGAWFEDIPLPGLDLKPRGNSAGNQARSRPYSATLPPTPAAVRAFWERVVKAPGQGCWIWTGAISAGDGYGRITWRSQSVSRTESAHRFALLIADDLPAGAVGEHRCNEPLCVRVHPDHLIASTQSANLRYAVACGRTGVLRAVLDRQDRHTRSLAVRAAVAGGWDPAAYSAASGLTAPLDSPPLF